MKIITAISKHIIKSSKQSSKQSMMENNFENDFQLDNIIMITQAVNNMIKTYLPKAYCFRHIRQIDRMIMGTLCNYNNGGEQKMLYKEVQDKERFFNALRPVVFELKATVSKRRCDNCKKKWCDCRDTCIKHKPNPNPIEFPQDVFNIIKDYMDIVDVPIPMWNDMMKASIKEIASNQSYNKKSLKYFKPYHSSVEQRKIPIALRKRRYWVGVIREAKNMAQNIIEYCKTQNPPLFERMFEIKREVQFKYPQFWGNFKFEATDYTWVTLQKIYHLMDKRLIGGKPIHSICKSLGELNRTVHTIRWV